MEAEPVGQKPPRRRRGRASAGARANCSPPADSTPGVAASCSRYLLRRGSSFTFLTPGPYWDFTLKRKRREKDDDVVSLCSLDFKIIVPHTRKMVCKMAGEITPVRTDCNALAILVYF